MLYRNKENPFMLANVDRLIVGRDAGLECKTASAYHADKWKDGKIPPHYLIQCLHYMAVTGKKEWYIAVVILGHDFLYQKITWDEKVIKKLVSVERAFWEEHILTGRIPAPDGAKACDELLGRLEGKRISTAKDSVTSTTEHSVTSVLEGKGLSMALNKGTSTAAGKTVR